MDAEHVLEGKQPFAHPAPALQRGALLTRMLRLALVLASGMASAAPVASASDIGYQIKASYIYNILKFVTFPSESLLNNNTIHMCLLGRDNFGEALDAIDGRSTGQGAVQVVRLGHYRADLSTENCHVIYVAESEARKTRHILAKADRQNTLTIGEFAPFVEQGGLIELYEQNDTIRFRINAALVKETHFKMASQLILLGVE